VIETLQAVLGSIVALLPGALFMWCFEREAGIWGINLPDRVLRFLGVSALLHLLAAPGTFWLWNEYYDSGEWKAGGHLPWPLYGGLLLYALVPIGLGLLLGRWAHEGRWLGTLLVGDRRPPRAWDHL
jgi:hypothetical protein